MQTRSGKTLGYNTVTLTTTAPTGGTTDLLKDLEEHPERSTRKYKLAFVILHLLGLCAHVAGLVLTAIDADLEASISTWRVQPKRSCPLLAAVPCTSVKMYVVKDVYITPGVIVVLWFGCSALFHSIVLTSMVFRMDNWYFTGMDRNLGFWRWLEYSVSASIMLLGATALIGTRETRVVVSSTVSIGVTMIFGWLTELNASKYIRTSETAVRVCGYKLFYVWDNSSVLAIVDRFHVHFLGYIPFALAWWLALDSFWMAEDAWVDSGMIVETAGESLIAGFYLFTLFGVVQLTLLALPYGPSVYWVGEICYCVLSVAAKWTMGMLLLYRGLTHDRIAQGASVSVMPA